MNGTHEEHGRPDHGDDGHLPYTTAQGTNVPREGSVPPLVVDHMSRADVAAPPSPPVEQYEDVKETFRAGTPEYAEQPGARFDYAHWMERALFAVFIGILIGIGVQLCGTIETLGTALDSTRKDLFDVRGQLDDALWKLESMQNITRALKVIGCE